ncbi:Conjugal transfer protein [Brevibacillus sp. IT-7CA2]
MESILVGLVTILFSYINGFLNILGFQPPDRKDTDKEGKISFSKMFMVVTALVVIDLIWAWIF